MVDVIKQHNYYFADIVPAKLELKVILDMSMILCHIQHL